jgi:hypothetical protein
MAYTAVVLTMESKANLIGSFGLDLCPEGWVIKAHHMTCDMKNAAKSVAADFVGQEVELEITAVGHLMTEPTVGIMAVEVKCCVPSKNAIKHITLAHHTSVKPVRSNDITEWEPVKADDPRIVLRGVVQEVA